MDAMNKSHNDSLLRFMTCGSVDDGKSTLIGRLLYDTKTILADTLTHIARTSKKRGMEAVDLSLLTDGLQAEREQGITIDVAYRYFSTGTRKYIIADAPGHEQYTRNMVTSTKWTWPIMIRPYSTRSAPTIWPSQNRSACSAKAMTSSSSRCRR